MKTQNSRDLLNWVRYEIIKLKSRESSIDANEWHTKKGNECKRNGVERSETLRYGREKALKVEWKTWILLGKYVALNTQNHSKFNDAVAANVDRFDLTEVLIWMLGWFKKEIILIFDKIVQIFRPTDPLKFSGSDEWNLAFPTQEAFSIKFFIHFWWI